MCVELEELQMAQQKAANQELVLSQVRIGLISCDMKWNPINKAKLYQLSKS